MKQLTIIITAALMMLLLASCGGRSSAQAADVWEKADLQYSVLGFGWREEAEGCFGHFNEDRFAILEGLKKVKAYPADDFTPDKMTYPVYSLEMQDAEGRSLPYVWTNGYLIDRDGNAYRFRYDFAKLKKKNFEVYKRYKIASVADLPGGYQLVQQDGRWIASCLTEAGELRQAENIELVPKYQSPELIRLDLINKGTEAWTYGEDYALQVFLEGKWYGVPAMTADGLIFSAVAYGVEPGQNKEIACSFLPFGKLPDGRYRIVKGGWTTDSLGRDQNGQAAAEFTVSAEEETSLADEASHPPYVETDGQGV
ncbi:MAG: hypothetical protein IJK47_07850 [Lachnospiraceae bacterium]|nr:hypothetical protein [Lachnospiraceae bacterium]